MDEVVTREVRLQTSDANLCLVTRYECSWSPASAT